MKAIRLDKQNNNFARASCFLYTSFFDVVEDMNTGKLTHSPLEINSRQNSPTVYKLKDKEHIMLNFEAE